MSTITPTHLDTDRPQRPDFSVALSAWVLAVLTLVLIAAAVALLVYGQAAPGL